MLLQATAKGINTLIQKCAGQRLPGIWERETCHMRDSALGTVIFPTTRESRIVLYHMLGDAIDGFVVGWMAPFFAMEDRGAPVMVASMISAFAGTVIGGIVGAVRGGRIATGNRAHPYYFDPLMGAAGGITVVMVMNSRDPAQTLIISGAGALIGTALMAMRMASNAVQSVFSFRSNAG